MSSREYGTLPALDNPGSRNLMGLCKRFRCCRLAGGGLIQADSRESLSLTPARLDGCYVVTTWYPNFPYHGFNRYLRNKFACRKRPPRAYDLGLFLWGESGERVTALRGYPTLLDTQGNCRMLAYIAAFAAESSLPAVRHSADQLLINQAAPARPSNRLRQPEGLRRCHHRFRPKHPGEVASGGITGRSVVWIRISSPTSAM